MCGKCNSHEFCGAGRTNVPAPSLLSALLTRPVYIPAVRWRCAPPGRYTTVMEHASDLQLRRTVPPDMLAGIVLQVFFQISRFLFGQCFLLGPDWTGAACHKPYKHFCAADAAAVAVFINIHQLTRMPRPARGKSSGREQIKTFSCRARSKRRVLTASALCLMVRYLILIHLNAMTPSHQPQYSPADLADDQTCRPAVIPPSWLSAAAAGGLDCNNG